MEMIVVLIGAVVLGIPVIAVIALVRTATTRRLLDEATADLRSDLSGMTREIAKLRRELGEASQRLQRIEAAPAPAALQDDSPASAAAAAKADSSAAQLHTAVVPPASQAAFTAQPQVVLRQAAPQRTPAPPAVAPQPPTVAAPVTPSTVAPSFAQAPPREPVPTPRAATEPAHRQSAPPQVPVASRPVPPPRKSLGERLRAVLPLEEVLGMNLFLKIGIALLVLGFAFLGQLAFTSMGPPSRVAIIFAAGAAMLGGGIWIEKRERYRLIGRGGIGGGWALLFFTAYAMHHVAAMAVLNSNTLDCMLMLLVAGAMVPHTLRYKSQVVTGLAFLLAFSTVALSQDSVYALAAGVILALAIVGIALRMGWYELEVFGIVASYANHFYWLYRLYPQGVAGHSFPQFWASTIILLLYWLVFRLSYVVRKIATPRNERVSTIAALLNTMLLGAVMKFQSTRPELAFYALLALGAAEFFFGQLPVTRRRRPAFILLTVMGTLLMFAAVPFKFSGNNIALFWMIAAEVLLVAGIAQQEVVFRRLGLFAGLITGGLIVYEARSIVDLRVHSELPLVQDGVLLLTCAALFYGNALFVGRRWARHFEGVDAKFTIAQSYLGCATAFLGVWALFTGDWTAVGWALLMLAAAVGVRRLNNTHLIAQATVFFLAETARAALVNTHSSILYPHHLAGRIVTLPILALLAYASAWLLTGIHDLRLPLRSVQLSIGTALLTALVWLELPSASVAPLWMALAIALVLLGRRIKVNEFAYQEHALAALVAVQLLAANLYGQSFTAQSLPFLLCAAALYAISRFCTMSDAVYKRQAAWAHTWLATALLATLACSQAQQPWLATLWALFALALALVDRFFNVEELPYQAHVLALMAVLRAVTLNLYLKDRWHGIDLRLITVSILIAVLYMLAQWVRMPQALRDAGHRHAYTWVASGLTAWLLWSELQPVALAPALALFGLVLFEVGEWKAQTHLRVQGYVALAAAFARIFFVNLTAAALPGEWLSPRIYTVAPIALILFYVWWRLQAGKASTTDAHWPIADLIAYLGSASIAALLYYQTPAAWIVVCWSVLALALMTAALLLHKTVFQQQATVLAAGIVGRGLAHNIFGESYFTDAGWRGSFAILSLAAAILLAALPIAFRLKRRHAAGTPIGWLSRYTAVQFPEQVFFFVPVVLVTFMVAVKMHPGMITLGWGIEGLILILMGLAVNQRSYRITGLLLLLLCVGKIVVRDAWQLEPRDRYITFIALGAALTLVSALYSRFRETVSKLL